MNYVCSTYSKETVVTAVLNKTECGALFLAANITKEGKFESQPELVISLHWPF